MAKPLPLIIGGIGLTGAAAGGVILAGGGGFGRGTSSDDKPVLTSNTATNTLQTQTQPQTQQGSKDEKFWGSLEEFKKGAKESSCVKDYFGDGLTIGDDGTEIAKDNPKDGDFFKKDPKKDGQSCLLIQWKKAEKTGNGKTWNGKFTWLWTFVRGDEGFISFNVIEPSTEAKKPKFTGGFYLIGKDSGKTNWTVKYKKEANNDDKKFDKNEWDKAFPKAHNDFKDKKNEYWDFLDSKDKVDDVCSTGSTDTCKDLKLDGKTATKLKWTSKEGGNKLLWDWSSSGDWWDKIYGVDGWKLKDKLKDMKGTWTADAGNAAQ